MHEKHWKFSSRKLLFKYTVFSILDYTDSNLNLSTNESRFACFMGQLLKTKLEDLGNNL